jgi:hypothetical protein
MILIRLLFVTLAAGSIAAAEPSPDLSAVAYPSSSEALLAEFPTVEANEPALELEALAAKLGIDLAPRSAKGRARTEPDAKKAWDAVRKDLESYVAGETGSADLDVRIPPLAVDRYLTAHRDTLDAVRALLVRGPHPRWERDLGKLASAGIPNLLGHLCIHKVLIADALAMEHAGDDRGALGSLEASWALNTSLRDEPSRIVQLIAVNITRLQAGTLRHLRGAGEAWSKRLREHDYRRSLLRAMTVEGFAWTQLDDTSPAEPQGFVGRIGHTVGKPYLRLCLDDAAERWKGYLESVARTESLCEADLSRMDRELQESIPWWNLTARNLLPSGNGLERVARLELDLELTIRLLELETVRARTGTWPKALPRGERSSACPGLTFVYDVAEDRTMTLALSMEPGFSQAPSGALVLPTRYVRIPQPNAP